MIDLHTHSNASDGSLSPAGLIDLAAAQGLSALALTDHDTINGIEAAQREASARNIRFIPGIELEIERTAEIQQGEFHLLGLGIDRPSGAFLEAVAELSRMRETRNLKILDCMRSQGIPVTLEEVRALSGGGSIGRPHFASFLVKRGIVKNQEQAFSRFLAKGKPFYMPKGALEFRRALGIIKESGGLAVLAHPMSLYVSWGRLPALIGELTEQGLDGIEAWHPTAKVQACKRLEALGLSLGLFITAGSDFHGEARADRKLGVTAGGRKIEDSFLEHIPPLASRPS
ncbi:MAG: PHP domain-containing protein [Spirochaetaceae bacterium]|jgi:predicted metal-dependent phosphoesterase TrpH|nr:PHP domain-containing protein [Spirochaetaceae bacterium]